MCTKPCLLSEGHPTDKVIEGDRHRKTTTCLNRAITSCGLPSMNDRSVNRWRDNDRSRALVIDIESNGCGSKKRYQNGILARGTKD